MCFKFKSAAGVHGHYFLSFLSFFRDVWGLTEHALTTAGRAAWLWRSLRVGQTQQFCTELVIAQVRHLTVALARTKNQLSSE
jgi:hypothetical protein